MKDIEKLNERIRLKRVTNPNKVHQKDKEYRERYRSSTNGYAYSLYWSARQRAKKKGIEFDLTLEWVRDKVNTLKCEATEFNLEIKSGGEFKTHPLQPTLDRTDNLKGYTKDNTRLVCWWWNVMKQDWPEDVIKHLIIEYSKLLV